MEYNQEDSTGVKYWKLDFPKIYYVYLAFIRDNVKLPFFLHIAENGKYVLMIKEEIPDDDCRHCEGYGD